MSEEEKEGMGRGDAWRKGGLHWIRYHCGEDKQEEKIREKAGKITEKTGKG